MKGTSCLPETLGYTQAGVAETDDVMMGRRGETGSRVFNLLASVIENCCKRGHMPWLYPAGVIAERPAGRAAASLPAPIPGL